jgi:DNA-binding NtrC family response regulator
METPAKHNALGMLEGTRLIVVEDDAILLMDLEAILRDAWAQMLSLCRTVEEGLAAAEMEGISAAMLDVRLGHDPAAPIARRGQTRDDPTIIEWPNSKLVTKPARPETIVAAILDVLHHRNAGEAQDAASARRVARYIGA